MKKRIFEIYRSREDALRGDPFVCVEAADLEQAIVRARQIAPLVDSTRLTMLTLESRGWGAKEADGTNDAPLCLSGIFEVLDELLGTVRQSERDLH